MSRHLELGKWKSTHNSPLEMLSEQGVIGLLIWVGLPSARIRFLQTMHHDRRRLGFGVWRLALLAVCWQCSLLQWQYRDMTTFACFG